MGFRRKKTTAEMRETQRKVSAMNAISGITNEGGGVTGADGAALLVEAQTALDEYNEALATADEKKNNFEAINRALRTFNKKVLPTVGLQFGTDSNEYEMVGGVRESERKKPGRKAFRAENISES